MADTQMSDTQLIEKVQYCIKDPSQTIKVWKDLWTKHGDRILALKDPDERTVLHWSAENPQCLSILTDCLSKCPGKLDPMVPDEGGWTPLHLASVVGNANAVQALLKAGAEACRPLPTNNSLPLHLSAAKGHKKVSQLLLEQCKDVPSCLERRNGAGESVIMKAVTSNNLDLIKFLASKGADLQAQNLEGENILHLACMGRSFDIIRWILQTDKSLALVDDTSGRDPLSYGDESVKSVFGEYFEARER